MDLALTFKKFAKSINGKYKVVQSHLTFNRI